MAVITVHKPGRTVQALFFYSSTGQTGRRGRNVLTSKVVRPLPNLWVTRYFDNKGTDCDQWHKWCVGQGHETISFGSQDRKSGSHDAEFGRWMPARGIVLDSFGSGKFF